MKKSARILAVLAAAATLGLGLSSCDYWDTEWYKNGGDTSTASSGGSGSGSSGSTASSGSAAYSGNLTVNSVAYTTLTMTGDASSGTAVLSGNGGSANGTYARSAVAAAANTLNLSGTYTLTFSFGTITVVFANNTVTISAGTVAASGTASIAAESGTASTGSTTTTTPASTEPAISTLNGKTFVNSSNSSNYIVGTSDSTCDWHNPPTYAVNLWTSALSTGMPSVNGATYDPSTGVITGCTYTICRGGEGFYNTFSEPYIEINYGTGSSPETIASATQFGSYVQQ